MPVPAPCAPLPRSTGARATRAAGSCNRAPRGRRSVGGRGPSGASDRPGTASRSHRRRAADVAVHRCRTAEPAPPAGSRPDGAWRAANGRGYGSRPRAGGTCATRRRASTRRTRASRRLCCSASWTRSLVSTSSRTHGGRRPRAHRRSQDLYRSNSVSIADRLPPRACSKRRRSELESPGAGSGRCDDARERSSGGTMSQIMHQNTRAGKTHGPAPVAAGRTSAGLELRARPASAARGEQSTVSTSTPAPDSVCPIPACRTSTTIGGL